VSIVEKCSILLWWHHTDSKYINWVIRSSAQLHFILHAASPDTFGWHFVYCNMEASSHLFKLTCLLGLYCPNSNNSVYLFWKEVIFQLIHVLFTHSVLCIVPASIEWKLCTETKDCSFMAYYLYVCKVCLNSLSWQLICCVIPQFSYVGPQIRLHICIFCLNYP
jgi:hypothetical protein